MMKPGKSNAGWFAAAFTTTDTCERIVQEPLLG